MAWTPSNLPNQIVLLGGSDENREHAEMTGEVIPGNKLLTKVVSLKLSPQCETPSNLHTADTKHVQLLTGKAWSSLEAEITPL